MQCNIKFLSEFVDQLSWLLKLHNMLQMEKNRRYAPDIQVLEKMTSLFQTLKTVMTLNLQEMVKDSLIDYMEMFKPPEVRVFFI